jgi:hypothetical protein
MTEGHQGDRRRARPRSGEADDGVCEWVSYGDTRMFVALYTPGGAPYGWVEGTDGSGPDEDSDHPRPEE